MSCPHAFVETSLGHYSRLPGCSRPVRGLAYVVLVAAHVSDPAATTVLGLPPDNAGPPWLLWCPGRRAHRWAGPSPSRHSFRHHLPEVRSWRSEQMRHQRMGFGNSRTQGPRNVTFLYILNRTGIGGRFRTIGSPAAIHPICWSTSGALDER
jgi:hypothetical protein